MVEGEFDLVRESNADQNGNRARFHAAQSQMIIPQANLDGIPKRRGPDHSYWGAGHNTHLHQPPRDCARSLDVDDSRRDARRERIE